MVDRSHALHGNATCLALAGHTGCRSAGTINQRYLACRCGSYLTASCYASCDHHNSACNAAHEGFDRSSSATL